MLLWRSQTGIKSRGKAMTTPREWPKRAFRGLFWERAMGLEPTTACLGSKYSTN